MSEIKARLTGGDPDGETLGVRLEDGDTYPLHVKHGGELPTEIDGRKVTTEFRDGLLSQEGKWTRVKRAPAPAADKTDTTTPAKAEKDGK
jgi:hypothetical protein